MSEEIRKEIVIRIKESTLIGEHLFYPVTVEINGKEIERITELTIHADLDSLPTITYTQYAIP